MGKSDPRRLGLGHYQFRFLDWYRTRRHTHLRNSVFASAKMAHVDQPFRGSDDAVCGDLRGDFPRYPRRPVLDGVVYGAYAEQLGDLAKFPQRADVGRVCGLDLFYCLGPVLVHRVDSGFGDVARSRNHKGQKVSFWNFCVRLARVQSQLAPLRNGIPAFGRPFYAAGPLGAQRGIIRLRFDAYTELAHHNLSALFRCWRDLRRVRDGADPSPAGACHIQTARCDYSPARRQNGKDHFVNRLIRRLRLFNGVFRGLV